MFRRIYTLLGTCLMVALLSSSSPVLAQGQPAGAEQPDQTFWQTIKDTTLPDLFAMFIERYPNSAHRPQAEQRLKRLQAGNQPSALEQARLLTGKTKATSARVRGVTPMPSSATRAPVLAAPVLATAPASVPVLAPAPAPAPASRPASAQIAAQKTAPPLISLGANGQYFSEESSPETILLIQYNLNRVGCTLEKLDGKWGPNSREAAARFATTIDQPLVTTTPNTDLLRVLKSHQEGTCAPVIRPAPLIKRPSFRKPQRAKRRTIVRKKQRAVKKRRTRRNRARASKKVKTRRVRKTARTTRRRARRRARTTRASQTNTPRRKTSRTRRKQQNVSVGGSRRNGGARGNGGGGQLYSIKRPGGSNGGGGQKSRPPGRGASNGGGGQRYSLPPTKSKGSKVRFPPRGRVRLPKFKGLKLKLKSSSRINRLRRK